MLEIEQLELAVESLQNILVARATGEDASESDFREQREVVLSSEELVPLLPNFVKTSRSLGQFWGYIGTKFGRYQERRSHIWDSFQPAFEYLESLKSKASSSKADEVISTVDSPHVQAAWIAALKRKDSDPEGAITAARTLLESVCKHILDQAKESYDDTWDLPKLYKAASLKLNLAPQQHSELVFKQILGGCATVVEGLGALRNKHGDAHGKGALHVRPTARHAGLAVHLAGGVAAFLIETYEEKGIKGDNP